MRFMVTWAANAAMTQERLPIERAIGGGPRRTNVEKLQHQSKAGLRTSCDGNRQSSQRNGGKPADAHKETISGRNSRGNAAGRSNVMWT